MHTIISSLTHVPDEYAILAMPDSESVMCIERIQRQLQSLLGDTIWLTPPYALHMTLMEIICDTTYKDLSRAEHYKNWYRKYNTPTRAVLRTIEPFSVRLSEIHASPAAIILKAANSEQFNHVRAALLEETELPAQTKLPPDITHSSIARYYRNIDLDIVRNKIASLSVDIQILVHEFRLIKDIGLTAQHQVEEIYHLGTLPN